MLYDRLLVAVDRSMVALESPSMHHIAHDELIRAQRIVDELGFALDLEAGQEIAANLLALYEFSHEQLVRANMSKDSSSLATVRTVFAELRDAWRTGVELNPAAAPTAAR
jgi:flagellar secretion chaperone FliS